MASRLVNVRLDEERLRKARMLRDEGVTLSDLVREAIDQRFDALSVRRKRGEIESMLAAIFERYPDPTEMPPRGYDVHNPRDARAAIRQKLRSRDR
jgi:hypothetical protein